MRFCVHPLKTESLFTESPVFSNVSHPCFQNQTFWGIAYQNRELDVGAETTISWRRTCDIPPVCRWPTSGFGSQLDCTSAPPTCLVVAPSLHPSLWKVFWASLQVVLKDNCFVSSCILVCPWEEISPGSFYFTNLISLR